MKRLLSLVLVASMLLSIVAAVPMYASAAEDKNNTDVEAYYFGGEAIFIDHEGAATKLEEMDRFSIKDNADKSKGTVVLDGTIDEGEWGTPAVFVDSKYAASNDGLTGKGNPAYEEASAENTYFYYNEASYLTPSGSYYPWEAGMNYSLYFMWDEEYLYIAADVYDASGHSSDGQSGQTAWDADTFQFRIDKDGPNGIDEGYSADGGLDADGNKIVNMPWRSSVYGAGGEITSEVPNFIVTRTSARGGYTLVRDNANRYFPHEEDVPSADNPDVLVKETRYADAELSWYLTPYEDSDSKIVYCETYEEYKASGFQGLIPEYKEYGAVYATAVAHKIDKKVMQTQYEIAVPWEYIDDAEDFMAEIGDEFGISTMVVDRQNSKTGSFGAFLEWGTGINTSHRPNYDPATCLGSNSLTLSATSYDEHVACDHSFAEATCTEAETCTKCGYQRGFKTGHDYELVSYKLPTYNAAGYANAVCNDCGKHFDNTLAKADDTVYKKFGRNDGNVDLTKALSSAFAANWTQMKWKLNAEGGWDNEAGAVVYNVDGENAGQSKNMLWLPGQTRPEIKSADHVDSTGIKNPYDFTVLDLTCFSETGSYFHLYDFQTKNSTVTMQVDLWNRLEGKDREIEAERGYHDTLAFWFGPNLIEYLAGLFIVEDKDADENVIATKYYFAITPNNSSQLSIAEFEETAFAYVEIDPSVLDMGQGTWNEMTFFVDYDANVALLFWDDELVVGEYDPHFTTTKTTADPILRVFNLEFCVTDYYAGAAGMAANYVANQGGDAPEEPETTEPETTEPETTEPEESEPEETEPEETEPVESEPEETEPEAPALGSYENPYILSASAVKPLGVTVAPGATVFVKTDVKEGTVVVGEASSADYMIFYGRQTVTPAGADNTASFALMMGNDTFQVYNASETDSVTVRMLLEAGAAGVNVGTIDNPEKLELAPDWMGNLGIEKQVELAAGNEGYYVTFTATEDGKLFFNVNAYDADYMGLGWTYYANNLTTGEYGDIIVYDNNPDVWMDATTMDVKAGDEILVFFTTYDPANMWTAPAGTANLNVSFAPVGSQENPEIILEPGDFTANVDAESWGYNYEYVVTEDGKITVTMNSSSVDGWQFNIMKTPADEEDYGNYYYGDTIDSTMGQTSETIDVKAGDKIRVCVNTYATSDDPYTWVPTPAGSVNWTLGFEVKEEFDGEGLLYTLTGEVIDDQLFVLIDITDNNEGIFSAELDFFYNNAALEFVSATGYNEVYNVVEFNNLADASKVKILPYMTGMDNSLNDGKFISMVFNIVDADADYGFELEPNGGLDVNHAKIDSAFNPIPVDLTFEIGEIKPPVIPTADINVSSEAINGQLHVYVDIANNPGIWALGFTLGYNSEVLSLAETIYGDVFGDGNALSSDDGLGFNFYGSNEESEKENITANGRVVELVFDVLDYEAESYAYGIYFDYDSGNVINANGKEVVLNVTVEDIDKVDEPIYTFDMGVTGVGIDGQLHVYVDATNNPGIWALGFTVEYNKAALELVDTIYGDVFGEGEALANGSIFFGNNSEVDSNITATGTIVELVFNVVDYDADYGIDISYEAGNIIDVAGEEVDVTVTIGDIEKLEKPVPTTAVVTVNGVATEYEIGATVTLHAPLLLKDGDKYFVFKSWTVEGAEAADTATQDITFVVTGDATITTNRALHGDVDGNGKLNAIDMAKLKKFLNTGDGDIDSIAANFDLGANGKVNAVDMAKMKKCINSGEFDYSSFEVSEEEVH